jgi:WD repeat-containing protein 35
MHVRAGGDHCVLATRTDDSSGQFILILCNAIGSPIDSKYIDVEPQMVADLWVISFANLVSHARVE